MGGMTHRAPGARCHAEVVAKLALAARAADRAHRAPGGALHGRGYALRLMGCGRGANWRDTPKRSRGWNKRETPRVGVLVRFEPEDLAPIDAARGDTPRQEYIVSAALRRSRASAA
jgi:hypothetical protein